MKHNLRNRAQIQPLHRSLDLNEPLYNRAQQTRLGAHGFTLLELLVVLAILGITAGITVTALTQQARSSAVREAALAFTRDFETVRSTALRTYGSASISFPTTPEITSYTLTLERGTAQETRIQRQLPAGIELRGTRDAAGTPIALPSEVVYALPGGLQNAPQLPVMRFEGSNDRTSAYAVRIVGVSGRVISNAL